MRFLSTIVVALIVTFLSLFFGHWSSSSMFTEEEFRGWFATCEKVHPETTQKLNDWAVAKLNKYIMNVASMREVDVSHIEMDDQVVEGFVFCCCFVHKQSISSIRSTVYYSLKRYFKDSKWGFEAIENFSRSYLAAVQRLKVSNKYVPSKQPLDPMLEEDLCNIVASIPPSLLELKAVISGVLSLSLCSGARSISLANVGLCDILQCVKVTDR